MSLSIGIAGLPNVGKSTVFKALTKKQVDASNFPFCTIDPNVGIVELPDARLERLSEISKSKKTIPTTVKFVDIAGLVAGAHKGEGLGNKFLANIREVDAICHIVRSFSDLNVIHVSGEVNPKSDMEVINLELIFSDMAVVAKRLESLKKEMRSGNKIAAEVNGVLEKVMKVLEAGRFASDAGLSDEEKILIKEFSLLTLKPMLYVANVNEDELDKKIDLPIGNSPLINISAKIEAELAELPENEAKEYMKELGITQSGLDKLIVASYKLLGLITFFTSGEPETRAWTVIDGAKAPQAAGVIHTDFEEKFIRAEVVSYNDFISYDGWNGAKEKGLMRLEGKDYIVRDGDVMFFRHGA
ncbi:redox-regulated ATPase YchF [Candidatus Falkowbacteria bacterium RBG_13_39_14]|uniref:Ribosome-binding ATPase YchF n=1 Tax=Candidatus Falkowbacteria bacterium RBG_13_39_14 TaxID=1797985 RepID=A0A1F5S6E6_9BACT|nr:MAG: redox-regulated ATPase YchF [Candidatus Falkowbacteria bacterium RBG_13_39_14]